MSIDRVKVDTLMIHCFKKVKGIVDVSPLSEKDKQEVINIESDAEKQSLMGLGMVISVGVREVLTFDLVYVALMDEEFHGGGGTSMTLKKGEVVVGEAVSDEETIARLSKKENVWFIHKNFVVYKDKISFPQDIMKKLCHFEIPSFPAEWRVLEESDFSYRSIMYAIPTTPTDIFLKNTYFEGLDQWGLGTILIGVNL
jgi:hypothetical protein